MQRNGIPETLNYRDGIEIEKLNFLINEAYPLISHGSLCRNTPCE